jgi:hypothetical protein
MPYGTSRPSTAFSTSIQALNVRTEKARLHGTNKTVTILAQARSVDSGRFPSAIWHYPAPVHKPAEPSVQTKSTLDTAELLLKNCTSGANCRGICDLCSTRAAEG